MFFQENQLSSVWQKFKPFVCASICQQTVLKCVSHDLLSLVYSLRNPVTLFYITRTPARSHSPNPHSKLLTLSWILTHFISDPNQLSTIHLALTHPTLTLSWTLFYFIRQSSTSYLTLAISQQSYELSLQLALTTTSYTLFDTLLLPLFWPSPALNNPSSLTHPTLTPKSHTLLDTLLLYLTLTYFISDPHQLSTILRALTPTCSHSNLSHSLGHSPTPDVLTLTSSYHWFLIQCALSRSFSFPLDLTLLL